MRKPRRSSGTGGRPFSVLIDNAPLRKKAADAFEKAMGDYDHLYAGFEGEMFRKPVAEASDSSSSGEGSRLKETYRILVRRRHPDLRADGDAHVSALWHEVQEAYQAGSVERMG